MFGKIMSIPDELMPKYFRLCTSLPIDEVDAIEAALASGREHPNQVKRRLGREIVALYHDHDAAEAAEAAFDRVFKEHKAPTDIPDVEVEFEDEVYVPRLLQQLGLVASAGEGRRLIDQGGVKLDGAHLEPALYTCARARVEGAVIQVGKRRFARAVSAGRES
jgi:tyrosyl-tRNA synthetase